MVTQEKVQVAEIFSHKPQNTTKIIEKILIQLKYC